MFLQTSLGQRRRRALWPILAALGCGLCALAASAEDWPQWRGPKRDGISQERGLLKEWPATGPKLLWQVHDIGFGYSTPAVRGDRLYLLSNEGLENEFVRAISAKDGKILWSTRIGKVGNPDQQPSYPGARSTPTLDGNLLYALSSDGDLACLEASTGQMKWTKNLRAEFSGQPGEWAYSESPLIDGEKLIVTPGGSQATLLALHKKTGAVIWKSVVPDGGQAAYASAIVTEIGGVRQIVQFLQKTLVGVDAKTGQLLWRFDKTAEPRMGGNIPTPVAYGGNVYSGAGLTGGGLAKITGRGTAFTAESVYFAKKLPNGIGGFVKIGDFLYGTSGQALLCVEFATGTVKWEDRSVGAGSLCYADGRLYVHGEKGEVALVEATPEGYREKGRFTPPNRPMQPRIQAWAYPVVANGRLYLRDLNALWCYDIRESGK